MNKSISRTLVMTTLVCLLPIVLALFMYNDLPEQMPVHWNAAGDIDRYMSKPFVVFGMPLFFALINIICIIGITSDPKKQNQSKWMQRLAIWIVPVMSLVLLPITLLVSIGVNISVPFIIILIMSIVFIIIGNYLPKSRQNYTIGIRLPWTLNDADNWNKTHRVGGICFIIGGIILFVINLLQVDSERSYLLAIITTLTIALLVIIPTVYSYVLYRKKQQ